MERAHVGAKGNAVACSPAAHGEIGNGRRGVLRELANRIAVHAGRADEPPNSAQVLSLSLNESSTQCRGGKRRAPWSRLGSVLHSSAVRPVSLSATDMPLTRLGMFIIKKVRK